MRKIGSVLPLFFFLMVLTSCQQNVVTGNNDKLIKSDNGDRLNKENVIEMKLDKAIYSSAVKEMTLKITNKSTNKFAYGSEFKMEIYRVGAWYEIPFKKNIAWDAVFYSLNPNEKDRKEKISTTIFDYHLEKGNYRIIKSFGKVDKSKERITVSAEFKIK